jgi:hypothetical protein
MRFLIVDHSSTMRRIIIMPILPSLADDACRWPSIPT